MKLRILDYQIIEQSLEALRSARGFIRKEVGKSIKLRITPELLFEKDESIEKGIYMSSLINKVIEKDEENRVVEDESDDE